MDVCFVTLDKGKEDKQSKQTRVDPTTNTANTTPNQGGGNKGTAASDDKKRVVTMEPSVRSFANPQTAARRDRSEPVMITDALADVRVK